MQEQRLAQMNINQSLNQSMADADLARQNCSACRTLAIPHAPLVPVKQLAGCGERLAQAVAMQCHLHICIAAEVGAGSFDPFWQTLA